MLLADGEVRDLVTRTGLDRTLFVEAGAGTGKTTVLVDRVVNLVTHQGVPLRHIAAITFTEAAASELANRVRVRFERLVSGSADPVVVDRAREALGEADLAALTTLHSFALRILTEHPLEVGLPPRFRVADEITSELAREGRWDRFVDALYDEAGNEELLIRAMLVGVVLEPRSAGDATLKDVALALGQHWDRLDRVAGRAHPPLPPVDFGPFDAAVADLMDLPRRCIHPDDKYLKTLLEKVLPAIRIIEEHAKPDRKLRALVGASEWKKGTGGTNAAWGNDVKGAKAAVDTLNEAKAKVLSRSADEVLVRLLSLVASEVQSAAATRRATGQLEYHDLLVLCQLLLRTRPDVRSQLHERYTHLLLDEFQDTDPIQVDLAVLIAATPSSGDGDVPAWYEAILEAGRLFFVGDPKQSIYRFRRADIALFLRAREVFGPDGSWLPLTVNFRTVPDVLTWVNQLFVRLLPEERPGIQPRHQALDAHRSVPAGADHRPWILGGPHDKVGAGVLRTFEADDVARAIAEIRTDPGAWPVFDEALGEWRPARLADITVLVPTRTSLPYLRAALTTLDIPYRLDTGTLVYDTQEVTDLLAVLAAIDDPDDHISLVAALRSPLYACADTDLFTFHQAGGRWNYRTVPPEAVDPQHPVAAAFTHLRSLWEQRWWLTPSTLLGRVVDERRAFVVAFGEQRPEQAWRRIRFLLDQARAFEEADGGDVRSFLLWADLQRSGSSRVHEPMLPDTDDPSIRIMTVHGAKGLEFPITILSGMTTRPGHLRKKVRVMWNEDGDPEIKLGGNLATANFDLHADLEAVMDEHEKLRLLYVACTRARDHLIVACHHTENDEKSYAARVWAHCAENRSTWRSLTYGDHGAIGTAGATQRREPMEVPSAIDRARWIAAREALLAPQRRSRFVSATTIAAEAGAAVTADLVEADDELVDDELVDDELVDDELVDDDVVDGALAEVVDRPVVSRRRGRAGTAVGRAVHGTLQVIDLLEPREIDAVAARQADAESIPELADTVAAMVRSALASPTLQMLAGRTFHKEMYVGAPIGERVIEGYVDLLVETPDGLVVVDYKTDTVRSEAEVDAKLATYELQGAAYAVAIEAATAMPVVACHFVFCRPAGAIERSVGDLNGAKERVREYLSR